MPLIQLPKSILQLCTKIQDAAGKVYLAGGMVRDSLLGLPSKDIDLEVHNISPKKLVSVLKRFGQPNSVGRSFQVWILNIEGLHVDISLSNASSLEEACRRRDLRINALVYDPLQDKVIDFFGGVEDIKQKILVETDPDSFTEDPLRVLRVAQLSARFGFTISPSLQTLCREVPLAQLPPERVLRELEKSWLKPSKPSLAIQELLALKVIEKYFHSWTGLECPEVQASIDRGKELCTNHDGWNMAIFWALALQKCSIEEAEIILDRINVHSYLQYAVRKAVFASLQFSKKLAQEDSSVLRNHAAEVFPLNFLCTIAQTIYPTGFGRANLQKARKTGIDTHPLPRLLQGRDILSFGIKGREIGICLSYIRKLELNEQIQNKDDGLNATQQWIQSKKENL